MVLIEKEIRFIDLFGGVGGFRKGLNQASEKFKCVGYYELDKYAVQTYNKNFNEQHQPTDITKVKSADIPDHDLICAGFPCQSFSVAGKRGGFNDTRGTLFYEIARIARDKRPSTLFLENVKGLLSHDNGRTFATILATLDELGYDAEWQVLNSKDWGVPQNRERVFIIGHLRNGSGQKIFPIFKSSEKPHTTSGEARSTGTRFFNYTANTLAQRDYKGGNQVIQMRDNNSKGYSEAEPYDGIRLQFPDSETARGRVVKQNSQTLQASGAGGVLLPDTQIRRLTPRECERLQGFPDDWTAGVSDTQRYKQMGNAVTVNVIRRIGEELLRSVVSKNV